MLACRCTPTTASAVVIIAVCVLTASTSVSWRESSSLPLSPPASVTAAVPPPPASGGVRGGGGAPAPAPVPVSARSDLRTSGGDAAWHHAYFPGAAGAARLGACAAGAPPVPGGSDQSTPLVGLALQTFGDACGGAFLDIGANDGVTISNSHFIETGRAWRGACVEPLPKTFAKLAAARPLCHAVNAGVLSTRGGAALKFAQVDGYAEMLSTFVDGLDPAVLEAIQHNVREHGGAITLIDVPTITLAELILDHADVAPCARATVHFASIDVETRELLVLQGVDFDRMLFHLVLCEASGDHIRASLVAFMTTKGYAVTGDGNLAGTNNVAFAPLPETVRMHEEAIARCPEPILPAPKAA